MSRIRGRDLKDLCRELIEAGRLSEASERVERAIESDPDDGDCWILRAHIRHGMGDFEAARDSLETAESLVPLGPASFCALADCYARTGRPDLARALYRDLAVDPASPLSLLSAIAAGLGGLGDDGPALATCLDLARREPSNHQAHFAVAFYLRRLGRSPQEMLPAVARACELAPEVSLYRVSYASLLDHLGRGDEARELLRDLDPGSVGCGCCLNRVRAILLGTIGSGDGS